MDTGKVRLPLLMLALVLVLLVSVSVSASLLALLLLLLLPLCCCCSCWLLLLLLLLLLFSSFVFSSPQKPITGSFFALTRSRPFCHDRSAPSISRITSTGESQTAGAGGDGSMPLCTQHSGAAAIARWCGAAQPSSSPPSLAVALYRAVRYFMERVARDPPDTEVCNPKRTRISCKLCTSCVVTTCEQPAAVTCPAAATCQL